ncbi:peptidase S13 D-Ala-D-Ala carboxypeptidase C [Halothece sp. PCC 7418]|uniref:D-alanyl-D-alanine carboxypeptidase n=1 Tax=Halothece sp. (strain PCC 7418) TaxID=65093 RepID=UPI0002A08CE7|nr:D-alanyl-D-alanine carboxypeptidase [Halothece sp. PCC 7418]AFZ45533.1 peptidase S13 D-Ala-D-Ala carboxypeptidase C [Halothece sp. PCC 7418]
MWDLLGWSALIGILSGWGQEPPPLKPVQPLAWEELALFSLPHDPDPMIEKTVANYLQNLSQLGINQDSQGVWLASDWWTFADHRGRIPQSAASLTKIATSLAALETYGSDYQFVTKVKHTGVIAGGVLQGDLIVEGGGDPFFVWEEAIALSNRLNELGIQTVTGNLIVTGDFFMNYQQNSQTSAQLLAQGLNSQRWSKQAQQQYQTLPNETPRPQVRISGNVIVKAQGDFPEVTPLIEQQSLPLTQILQQMNIYSNNKLADLIARSVGGVETVEAIVRETTGVSPEEVQLINGSGLGVTNRLSPRAVTKMLRMIDGKLNAQGGSLREILPVSGIDVGTVRDRAIPQGIPVKTGSLWNVSALAGVMNTEQHGRVYFAMINQNGNLDTFRQQQDQLLQSLQQQWDLIPFDQNVAVQLGDPTRID